MIKNKHDEVSYTYHPKNEFDEVIEGDMSNVVI